jgi:hypothetical protein
MIEITVTLLDSDFTGEEKKHLEKKYLETLLRSLGSEEAIYQAYHKHLIAMNELGEYPSPDATPEQDRNILLWEDADGVAAATAFGRSEPVFFERFQLTFKEDF